MQNENEQAEVIDPEGSDSEIQKIDNPGSSIYGGIRITEGEPPIGGSYRGPDAGVSDYMETAAQRPCNPMGGTLLAGDESTQNPPMSPESQSPMPTTGTRMEPASMRAWRHE